MTVNMKKTAYLFLILMAALVIFPVITKANEIEPQEQPRTVRGTTVYNKYYGDAPFMLDAVVDGGGKLKYQSFDPDICTVDNTGKVTIKGVGEAFIWVTIVGGDFLSASEELDITINVGLKETSITKVKATKLAHMQVTWKQNQTAEGYELQYSYNDKKFQDPYSKKIKKNSTTKYTIPNVVGGQKVYVRLRCYRKTGSETLYSKWSKTVVCKSKLAKKSALVPLRKLKNLSSLTQGCSYAQLRRAYKAIRTDMRALVGLSKKRQLQYIAVILRSKLDSGKVRYSMSAPHYADAYGYFIKGVSSCAGCARATGLCLNMLGYSYEHVNENKYSHQWCRVKVGKAYWICDAYGLYVGKEPGRRKHPRFR